MLIAGAANAPAAAVEGVVNAVVADHRAGIVDRAGTDTDNIVADVLNHAATIARDDAGLFQQQKMIDSQAPLLPSLFPIIEFTKGPRQSFQQPAAQVKRCALSLASGQAAAKAYALIATVSKLSQQSISFQIC